MTPRVSDQDLDQMLAEAAPRTLEYTPPASVREQIMSLHGRSARGLVGGIRVRRPRAMRFVVAPGAIAAAAVAVFLVIAGQQTDGSLETANAATIVLNRAADATVRTGDYPDSQFRYARQLENLGDGLFVVETWRRSDGSLARRVVTHNGKSHETPVSERDGASLTWTGLDDHQILALPTRPGQVVAVIRSAMARPQPVHSIGPDGKPTTRTITVPYTDHELFTAIMALHDSDLPLTPEQRAALLRGAATIPGVTSFGQVRDPLGRTGNAISIRGDAAHEGYGRVYVLSPTSGHTIATLEVRHGTVTGWSARQEGAADSSQQRPLPEVAALPRARYGFGRTPASPRQP
jgi:hypothetical protein